MPRKIQERDFDGLMKFYMQLHSNPFHEKDENITKLWESIISDSDHHIIAAEADGQIVSSCIYIISLKFTRGQRSYVFRGYLY